MSSRGERPTYDDLHQGWKTFFKIVNIIMPSVCIVLGSNGPRRGSLGHYTTNEQDDWKLGEWSEMVRNYSKDGHSLKIIFISHPSSPGGFRWNEWAEFVHTEAPKIRGLLSKAE